MAKTICFRLRAKYDRDIEEWLDTFDKDTQSDVIRRALRAYLQRSYVDVPYTAPPPQIDSETPVEVDSQLDSLLFTFKEG